MIKNKYRNKKLTQSAKHESCVSCGNPHSCWAHSNQLRHGKGTGTKAHDLFGAYLCQRCHDWFDGRVEMPPLNALTFSDGENFDKARWFELMNEKSLIVACEKGYL